MDPGINPALQVPSKYRIILNYIQGSSSAKLTLFYSIIWKLYKYILY